MSDPGVIHNGNGKNLMTSKLVNTSRYQKRHTLLKPCTTALSHPFHIFLLKMHKIYSPTRPRKLAQRDRQPAILQKQGTQHQRKVKIPARALREQITLRLETTSVVRRKLPR